MYLHSEERLDKKRRGMVKGFSKGQSQREESSTDDNDNNDDILVTAKGLLVEGSQ